ncbi:UDP-N-acetylmuramoylalanyl-D-glutamate--2,6-diaminopimelate ligase [Sporobacter termitidis DSM 10068]|uniref:UDP-N-acetylmuramoyl-L-alanyl-D-glutamate--2,6-diaminopimelate ligase n=1 Tax=Sporobacter termitidis DSM 10068 TaxID=1123282 RepID=A0A1M5WZ21_9FIRM|nr:UDP-N-acetylmuramoyl-L-alanyl-D-glutamate--2,6-diaminopimelate ligase [Sporobacter termitidis]SHH92869.1 UDP-N-acetylmuramoylalanyl-D-glutamate--2,6-diaminopimelate ligase [Sporobacter termitidis DSM 10068]
MKLAELLKGIPVLEFHADEALEITGVSYDSRAAAPGNLFVAVRGYESDGHEYIGAAVKNGAACVLCEEKPEEDIPYILTDNTRRGLAVVSAVWFNNPASRLILVGVTGTNGKTTTTHLIKTLIEKCSGAKVGLIGTNYNMIGDRTVETERTTPESYELQKLFRDMADEGCTYAVMEVSSHALFLDRVYGLTYEVGVFTNLTHEHLDFHKTMDEYAKAKSLLFRQSNHAVVNLDDSYAGVMIGGATCPVFTFSTENDTADLVAKRIKVYPDKVDFCALTMEKLQKIELNIPAIFSVYNALAAVAAGLQLGFELEALAEAMKDCTGVKGRIEVVPTGRDFTVIIDYAHKPYALENIISTFKEFAPGRVVTLFGCGGDRDATKRPLMGEIAARLSDYVIVTSDNPRTEDPKKIIDDILVGMKGTKTPYIVIENRREAIGWALKNAQSGDILILAGKGHETYQIIGKEKFHFDEREVVREFLSAIS